MCGEPCEKQVCHTCADPDVQDSVVDQILFRTLADVDPDMETIDDMTITIPNCGHVFTVETLDGICDMAEFYERSDDDTRWVGLKAPPSGFVKPPTCPTCRAAITCPRYGRIFKRADLDILERNVTSAMSQSLAGVSHQLQQKSPEQCSVHVKEAAIVHKPQLVTITTDDKFKQRAAEQKKLLKETRQTPLPPTYINAAEKLHGVTKAEVAAWRQGPIRSLFTAYQEAFRLADTRSAHTHAWEASFAYLYNCEMESAAQDPARAPRNPQEHAMRMARMKVGQPQPRADMRFRVEAFWHTINIRLVLVDLVQAWTDKLFEDSVTMQKNRRLWDAYASFLLKTCAQDAQIALHMTVESGSHRQTVRTQLIILRIALEQFRFNVAVMRHNSRMSVEQRSELANRAHDKWEDTKTRIRATCQEYLVSRSDTTTEGTWLAENFVSPAQTLLDEWRKLETSLRRDTFYQQLSLQEMTDVVKALNFCK